MGIDIDPIDVERLPEFVAAFRAAFGGHPSENEADSWRGTFEPDRSLVARDEGAVVATASAHGFDFTLPGSTTVPVAGVTAVGVLPTHRRRGILTAVMARQLEDVAARGEPMAILLASESVIYGRFGYGLATFAAEYDLAVDRARLAVPPADGGRFRLLDRDEAAKVLPGVFDAARVRQPGQVSRSQAWWETHFLDLPDWRHGASAMFYAVHESAAGEADGFVEYRLKPTWDDSAIPAGEARIDTMAAVSDEVEAMLWRYCTEIDLVRVVKGFNRPVDEPFRHRLADPRQLRTRRVSDFLWVRVLDVPAALEARRYPVEDRLVLEIHDAFRPSTSGRYGLEAGPDGASCARTDAEPDLVMSVADLGSVCLGGVRPTALASAGRIDERSAGSLRRADLLFGSDRAPFCATGF